MKQGDLEPNLIIDITGPGGDLNDVVSWRIIGKMRGAETPLFSDILDPGAVVVDPEDPTKAAVTRPWIEGDTATVGVLLLEVEAIWPSGKPQTFPANGYSMVRISDDLD